MANRGKLYVVEGDQLVRKNEFCPRCGPGVFLATHHDRRSCGRCGYSLSSQADVDAPAEVKAEAPAEAPPEEPAEEPAEAPPEEPAEAPAEDAAEEAADPEV